MEIGRNTSSDRLLQVPSLLQHPVDNPFGSLAISVGIVVDLAGGVFGWVCQQSANGINDRVARRADKLRCSGLDGLWTLSRFPHY